jgi:Putative Actinobacterial Holin-X, holin superfamily III
VSAGPTPPSGGSRDTEPPHNIAAAIAEVSERAQVLVREEIELAKAEVTEKATRLVKGAIVGIAAGVFVVTAIVFALVGCAWLLYYYLPGNDFTYFWGFFAMAVILLLLGVLAGALAAKAVKKGAPPTPDMAIAEAQKIKETMSKGGDANSGHSAAATGAPSNAAGSASEAVPS